MQPEPVPTSTICSPSPVRVCFRPARISRSGQTIERNFDDVLCFGAGNQHVGSDFKLECPRILACQ